MSTRVKCPCGKRPASRPGGLCGNCFRFQPKPGDPVCRHCGKKKANRARGLCWPCYYTPGVKEEYGSESKFAQRGLGNGGSDSPPPAEPTNAPPGSLGKMQVMRQRLLRGESLFHPDDNRIPEADRLNPFPDTGREHGNGRRGDEPTGLDGDDGVATLPEMRGAA